VSYEQFIVDDCSTTVFDTEKTEKINSGQVWQVSIIVILFNSIFKIRRLLIKRMNKLNLNMRN